MRCLIKKQHGRAVHHAMHRPPNPGTQATMSESETTSQKPVILPFQQSVFDRLCAVGRGCLNVDRSSFLSVKIRACFMLIGPTGSGKTFLARTLAEEMRVPFLSISISDWILLGSTNRGGAATWPVIFDFVERSKQARGAIIFIDELDKCCHESNWNAFLRSEIFSLCDSRIPLGINDSDHDRIEESRLVEAGKFLASKTMILAGAAFQDLWDQRSRPAMGFLPSAATGDLPELPDLAKVLPRELINRFSSEIFVLPELAEKDYRAMVETMADGIPDLWRQRFLALGLARLEQAVSHQKGARYLEEILLSAIVEERGSLANFVPLSPPEKGGKEPEEPRMRTL